MAASETFSYTIRFENDPKIGATAPVQELVVVDYLDANLDWTSVRFGTLSYGDRMIAIPPEAITFSARDVPPTNSASIAGRTQGALADRLALTHSLPNGLALVSASPSAGTVTTDNGSLLWNVGALTNSASATLSVTVTADRAGEFRSNTALSGGAGETSFSLPIVVRVAEGARPAIEVTTDGSVVQLSWPEAAKGFVLESAAAVEGAPWTRVTETPTVTGGQFRISVTVSSDARFFRLRRVP